MQILLLGNGFDLAHGLSTSYGAFLSFVKIMTRYSSYFSSGQCSPKNLLPFDFEKCSSQVNFLNETNMKKIYNDAKKYGWRESIETDNLWIRHFVNKWEQQAIGEKWIDFEAEISKVVQDFEMWIAYKIKYRYIEPDSTNMDKQRVDTLINNIYNPFLFKKNVKSYELRAYEKKGIATISLIENFNNVLKVMESDLDELIFHLEIYLQLAMEQIDQTKLLPFISSMQFDKIISFNYTNTYERVYDLKKEKDYHYVHGQIEKMRPKNENNMVLGVEEYLEDDERNILLLFGLKNIFNEFIKIPGLYISNGLKKPSKNRNHMNYTSLDILWLLQIKTFFQN